MTSISDSMITLVQALETAKYETADFARRYEPDFVDIKVNFVMAGLLADVLERDSNYTLKLEDIRAALMLLTDDQFAAIIKATARGESADFVERIKRNGFIPERW